MDAVPIHRTLIIRPFKAYLQQLGAPVEDGLRKAKLPVESIDDPEHYISGLAFWNFVGAMARREGIKDLGFLVGESGGANCIHPTFRESLTAYPTLYQALVHTCKILATETTRSHLTVACQDTNTLRFIHHTSFGREHPSHYLMEWFALSAMVDIVRVFAGPDWSPAEISLTSNQRPGRVIESRFPHTRFLTGQQSSHLCIDTALLSAPPFTAAADSAMTPASTNCAKPADDFAGSIKQLLSAYLPEGTPSIELIAEIAGIRPRTMQRQLRMSGLSYRELLEQARYDTATQLLAQTDEAIMVIAHRLGYDEPTHFARAFRRMTGISPGQYRRQHNPL
jgi:AraC-like DNA-binding protein